MSAGRASLHVVMRTVVLQNATVAFSRCQALLPDKELTYYVLGLNHAVFSLAMLIMDEVDPCLMINPSVIAS